MEVLRLFLTRSIVDDFSRKAVVVDWCLDLPGWTIDGF